MDHREWHILERSKLARPARDRPQYRIHPYRKSHHNSRKSLEKFGSNSEFLQKSAIDNSTVQPISHGPKRLRVTRRESHLRSGIPLRADSYNTRPSLFHKTACAQMVKRNEHANYSYHSRLFECSNRTNRRNLCSAGIDLGLAIHSDWLQLGRCSGAAI